jgi:predicted AAA+ superfamily ATPase
VDSRRDARGQYLLTGSQNLLLMAQVTETLAGRAALLRLLPLSLREIEGSAAARLPWERGVRRSGNRLSHRELWKAFLRGGYPEIALERKRDLALWHRSYIQTYLERDVRTLRQVGDLTQFQNFMRALAARSAQLFNLTDLSRDLGVVANTVKAWLSVLEASFQIVFLRPYYANLGKRLVKTPKVYFTDVGTLCHLVGLRDPEHAARGPMGGAIFETAVLSEIMKTIAHRGEDPQVYFFRTSAGKEVDFVVEAGGKLVPLEVKLSATPLPAMANTIETFRRDLGGRAARGYVIHSGTVELPLTKHATALPFGLL